jgi:hypothetical protein
MFHTFTPYCKMHMRALLIRHKVETAVSANAVVMTGLIKSWCCEVWNIVLVLAAVSGFVKHQLSPPPMLNRRRNCFMSPCSNGLYVLHVTWEIQYLLSAVSRLPF